jgi:hypothetical protein
MLTKFRQRRHQRFPEPQILRRPGRIERERGGALEEACPHPKLSLTFQHPVWIDRQWINHCDMDAEIHQETIVLHSRSFNLGAEVRAEA